MNSFWNRVTRSAGGVDAWEAGVNRRKRGESGVWFGLIPIGDAEEIVGAMIGVAVFDGGTKRFCEWDGRIEMETVDARAAAGELGAHDGRAHQGIRKRTRAEIPGTEEIIFGASAVDGGN